MTTFRPPAWTANGTAIVILPGGSFRALAWDVDGLEPARWLASKGVTAFVLKYRVRPPQKGESFGDTLQDFAKATKGRRAIAVADAMQAIRVIRASARRYGVSPDRIGVMGSSAGAMAAIEVALATDPALRPNFAISMYAAGLTSQLPDHEAPPLFIAAAQDDPQLPASSSVEIFQRWTEARRPAELHVYEKGGHGFGFRPHQVPADKWPNVLEAWLSARGYLEVNHDQYSDGYLIMAVRRRLAWGRRARKLDAEVRTAWFARRLSGARAIPTDLFAQLLKA
jgi:acetyl esterase/lipase